MSGDDCIRGLLSELAEFDEQALRMVGQVDAPWVELDSWTGRELLIGALAAECRRNPAAAMAEVGALRVVEANTERMCLGLIALRSRIVSQIGEAEEQLRGLRESRSYGDSACEDSACGELLVNRLA